MNEINEELSQEVNHSWLHAYGDNKYKEGKIERKLEGLGEGELKGKRVGLAQRKRQEYIQEILTFLEKSFAPVPSELRKRIENIASLQKAGQALGYMRRTPSLEEFSRRLDELHIK